MITARSIQKSALLAPLLFGQACLEDKPTEPGQAWDGTLPNAAMVQAEQLGENPYMVSLAHEIPGFGGIYFDPPGGDRIVVAITDAATTDFAGAQEAVRDHLVASVDPPAFLTRPVEIVRRSVDYPFLELARHRANLRPHLLRVPGVVSLDVDEVANRIAIGTSDESARAAIRDIAGEIEIPLGMLSFHEESMPVPSYARPEDSFSFAQADGNPMLDGPVPDGKLQGGYEIAHDTESDSQGVCTLGFTALVGGDPSRWFFVTASHCSERPFDLDYGHYYQPENGDPVGVEYRDPERDETCENSSGEEQQNCRWSDANLVQTNGYAPILPGIIGRPERRIRCQELPCRIYTEIDLLRPPLKIGSIWGSIISGMEVDKIGRSTGWTYGEVIWTNKDIRVTVGDDYEYWIRGQHEANMLSGSGDSGSPVFLFLDGLSVGLIGIMWGGADLHTTWISPFANIELELGELDATYKSWNDVVASIDGPKMVIGPVECSWDAVVDEDRNWGPWSYHWWGILSGDNERLTGTPTSTGRLYLKVTDQRGMSATDSLWVQVVPDDDPPGCYDEWDPSRVF